MKALPGWKHPYELMPGYPLKQKLETQFSRAGRS